MHTQILKRPFLQKVSLSVNLVTVTAVTAVITSQPFVPSPSSFLFPLSSSLHYVFFRCLLCLSQATLGQVSTWMGDSQEVALEKDLMHFFGPCYKHG